MSLKDRLIDPRNRLDIVAGVVDGILNGLTLAAGKLLHGGGASWMLVLKVGAATGFTTFFVFFLAHYAQARTDLVRAERELNLLKHGRLATTRLGQQVLAESLFGASIAAVCGLLGSFAPLLLAMALPPVIGIALTLILLAVLGAMLARTFYGSPWIWAVTVAVGGVALTYVGIKLDIVG
jgi:predicted membrane protein (TIGR00267 family)